MLSKLPNYLSTYRKRNGLSRTDVAFLLGSRYRCFVGKYERSERAPNLENAFALQVMFGVPAHQLLPEKFSKVENNIQEQARVLVERYENSPRKSSDLKLRTLRKLAQWPTREPAHDVCQQ